jgi:hypothetical protein
MWEFELKSKLQWYKERAFAISKLDQKKRESESESLVSLKVKYLINLTYENI